MSGFRRSGGYGRSRDGDYGGSTHDMFVPAAECGKIIGRGGSKIRELQDQTRCQIKVCRDDEGDGTRRVELSGPEDAVEHAIDMINYIVNGGDRGQQPQQSYGQSYGGGGGGPKEVIRVDSGFVGRIIGKGGSRIRELQEETGCRINVSRDGGNYGQTEVELIGSRSAIQLAKDRIDEITTQY